MKNKEALLIVLVVILLCWTSWTVQESSSPKKCERVSECLPCTEEDVNNQAMYCSPTNYFHMIECEVEETVDDKKEVKRKTMKENCRPDIIYTPHTILNLAIFEVSLFAVILVAGFLFYRRTKQLTEQQNERYRRLVRSTPTNR